MSKIYYLLTGIIVYTLIIFYPNFSVYFHMDDFINLGLSENFLSVISSFNLFSAHPDFPFYRPVSVQLYFYLLKSLFGFNPLGYHLISYALLVLTVLFVYRLVLKLAKKETIALIATAFFAINSTHFAAMASAAYAHEIIFSLFAVLTIFYFLQKRIFVSLFFLILALMSKESAVMLPPILTMIAFFQKRSIKKLLPFFLILGVYLFGHFFYYGLPQSPSYQFILGKQNINILVWYALWSLSVPNILIDFVGPGLKINPTFMTVSGVNGQIFFIIFIIFTLTIIFLALKERSRLILIGLSWFILGLIPVLIFPLHKLAIEQSFPMIGLVLSVAVIISNSLNSRKVTKIFAVVTLTAYVILATNSIYLARRTHWIIRSAAQAKAVIDYLKPKISSLPQSSLIYFADGEIVIPEWGSSKQMYLALGRGKAINIIFNRPDLIILFASQNDPEPNEGNPLVLNSSQFLQY